MTTAARRRPQRHFCVHPSGEARAHGGLVRAVSFEEAALEYVETRHPPADARGDVSLMVEDCESGERQCLRIDLASGETAPCD